VPGRISGRSGDPLSVRPVALAAPAAAGDWLDFQGDAAHSGHQRSAGIGAGHLRRDWSRRGGRPTPIVVDGALYYP
jgi:hypothetical protein